MKRKDTTSDDEVAEIRSDSGKSESAMVILSSVIQATVQKRKQRAGRTSGNPCAKQS